jgi:acyl-CoA dehydrogenase
MDDSEFRPILEAVRDFVTKEVRPAEDLIEQTDEIPDHLRRQAAAMGLFGYALPESFGGLGLDALEDVQLAMEFGRTTPSFRSMFGTNNGIAGQVLVNAGTEDQQQRLLPKLASGELVASFALTEPEAGSDPSGLRSTAIRDGDGYVLNGRKRFITNAARSDVLMVFARTGPLEEGSGGISVFVVDTHADGVTVGPKDVKMGQRGSTTSEVYFDDVRVAVDDLVGGREGLGYTAAMRSLAKGRLHIAGICVGMADRLLEESVSFAATSRQGGEPIGRFQLVQGHLADIATELQAGRAMVLDAARRWVDGSDRRVAPSAAKLFCSEMVGRAADRAVQIHGGLGYMSTVPVERFYRDARLFRIYEGTSEVQRTIIGRALLKQAGMAT